MRCLLIFSCCAVALLLAVGGQAGSVGDPIGDTVALGYAPPDPDLVRASVDSDGVALRVEVEFRSDSFDPAATTACFAFDLDQCATTGYPGLDSNNTDAGLVGPEYYLFIGPGPSGHQAELQRIGLGGAIVVGSTTWPVTVTAAGYLVSLPLDAVEGDQGSLSFKVMSVLYGVTEGYSAISDYLPDPGLAPGEVAPLVPRVPVWDDEVPNRNADAAYDPLHDEYLVVWQNQRSGSTDIYARRIDGEGGVLTWFSVVASAGESNFAPAVAYDPVHQRYLVVWSGPAGVAARTVSWNGGEMGPIFTLDPAAGLVNYPDVVYSSAADEFLVVFAGSWSGQSGIGAQRIRAADTALVGWSTIATSPPTGLTRLYPKVAYDGVNERYLVAYCSYELGVPGIWLRGKLLELDLAGAGAAPEAEMAPGRQMINPSLGVAAAPGEYLVVWEGVEPATSQLHLYGRRVSGDGDLLGDSGGFQVSAIQRSEPDGIQDVTYSTPLGVYLAVWDRRGCDSEVAARAVHTGADVPKGGERRVDDGVEQQWLPTAACGSGHSCLVAYTSRSGDDDIAARRVELALHADGFESGSGCGWSRSRPALDGLCVAPGTVALWHLNEGTGQGAADSAPLAQEMMLGSTPSVESADPSWSEGRFAAGLLFAGSAGQLATAPAADVFPDEEMSVEVWVRPTGGSGSQGEATVFIAEPYSCHLSVSVVENWMRVELGNGSSFNYTMQAYLEPAGFDLDDGSWHYLAAIRSGAELSVYVDGSFIGGMTSSASFTVPASYTIGGSSAGFLDGGIDEVRVSRVALTPNEIAAAWQAAQAGG